MKTPAERDYTDDQAEARIYSTGGRGMSAARRMFDGSGRWFRIVEITTGRFVIDTASGYIAR